MLKKNIILAGGAGLVGQNLVLQLKAKGYSKIVVIDKHCINLNVLKSMHPDITAEHADLAVPGKWQSHFTSADAVVMLQAQIGGNNFSEFVHNNIESTQLIIKTMKTNRVPDLIHVSSSVVVSEADDYYTRTKREQEIMVLKSGIARVVLRPTLMFGWFDRKHLGWLSRFMKKVPVFPIPGHGRYIRQPLYVQDFTNIIISCLENPSASGVYNISGRERVDYIDIVRGIKRATQAKAKIMCIPYTIFYTLLWVWGVFDKNPPFTNQQLAALRANDEFEIIDWPSIFSVPCTPFDEALNRTFNDPRHSVVLLDF